MSPVLALALAAAVAPVNPYLADSAYPLGHSNSAQIDSTHVPGPLARSHALQPGEIEYALTGPGHLGNYVSGAYPDGRRVIWSNGPRDIRKLDYDSLRIVATFPLPGYREYTEADAQATVDRLDSRFRLLRLKNAFGMIREMLPADLSSVYCLLDRDGNFFAGSATGITRYGDARTGDPASPIAVRGTWKLPATVAGALVGMNMTYDGWLIVATDAGYVLAIARDFSQHHVLALPHREEAAVHNARMTKERRQGYNWIRNALAVDESGGIYAVANGWMHKVMWTGHGLSAQPADGAWAEAYPNGTGYGSGSTPVLSGFGDDDRLVAITDGEPLMNLTLYWRDRIPPGWQAPAGTSSPRAAGRLPVTMGDPARRALQSEQAVVAAGRGFVVVDNEPPKMPFYVPARAKGLLISLLADDPDFTPHGMQKFEWDPVGKRLRSAWFNDTVSSANCVPYASLSSNRVYTVGVRDGRWLLEAVNLATGASEADYELPGARFNTLFSGIYVDAPGRITYGGLVGVVRLTPAEPR